jgi:hypothetical protein
MIEGLFVALFHEMVPTGLCEEGRPALVDAFSASLVHSWTDSASAKIYEAWLKFRHLHFVLSVPVHAVEISVLERKIQWTQVWAGVSFHLFVEHLHLTQRSVDALF